MAGLLVEVGSLPSPPYLSGHCSRNQLISASLNAHCPRLMNHEAGCRTEIPVFMFRPPGRKGPAEPQIWASCSNPDSPELCGAISGGQCSQWSLVVTSHFLWLLWSAPPLICTYAGWYGYPLLYSCLENPMDRGAWWARVHEVTESWTRLKGLSMHTCTLPNITALVPLDQSQP